MRQFGTVGWRTLLGVAFIATIGGVTGPVAAQEGGVPVPVAPRQVAPSGAQEISLAEALQMALTGNRELEAARLQLVQAEGRVREAWGSVLPKVDASANYSRNLEVPGSFLPAQIFDPDAEPGELILVRFGSDNNWFGQVHLEQPIFSAGLFIGVGAAARYQSLAAEAVRGQTHAIVTRTKQLYFNVLLAQEAARLNEESVRRVQQALVETQAMRRAGLVGDYDVLRLEVELANLEPALRRAQNGAQASRRSLAVELGLEDAEVVNVVGSLAEMEVGAPGGADALAATFGVDIDGNFDAQRLIDLARQNRSEIRQADLTRQLRVSELKAEQSEYLPKLSFFATYGYSAQGNGAINPFGFTSGRSVTSPQIGLSISMPIFNGLKRPARLDQIRATLGQAQTQVRLVGAQVDNQVTTLVDQVQEARARAQAQQAAVGQARRGYEIVSLQFREGLSSRLELTDAEVALRLSEFNYAQAVHDYLTARTQLDQAVGVVPEVNR